MFLLCYSVIVYHRGVSHLIQLQILQVVGVNYDMFGIFLLNDETGSQVDIIVDDCHGMTERIVMSILKE